MNSLRRLCVGAGLLLLPAGIGAQTYFDTNGTDPGYGSYAGSALDGLDWAPADGGTTATGAFPGSNPTVVFSIDENTWTAFGQTIGVGSLSSFDIGGLEWRWVGSALVDYRRVGLNGSGAELNVVNGSVFDIQVTSTNASNGLLLQDWTINGNFTKTGAGDLSWRGGTLNGVATLSAGTVALSDTSGNDYGSNSIFNVTGAAFNVNGAEDFTVGGFTGNGTISNSGGGAATNATITFSGTGTSDFSGTLLDHPNTGTGVRNLAKTGSGTQVFSGSLQTEGATSISAGVFAVDGTHSNAGQYNVTGGTLAGSGTIDTSGGGNPANLNAPIMISAAGQLAPGRDGTIDTLTLTLGTGTLDLTGVGSGRLLFDLGASTDLVVVNGTITLDTLEFGDFTFTELGGLTAGTYDLFTSSGLIGGLGANLSGTIGTDWIGTLQTSGNHIQLDLAAIPEPGTVLLFLTGLGGVLLALRVRQAKASGKA